jgi:hypothetical protein
MHAGKGYTGYRKVTVSRDDGRVKPQVIVVALFGNMGGYKGTEVKSYF